MANALYPKFKQELLKATAAASLNGTGTTGVYAALIDIGVATYNAAHQYFNSIAAGQIGTEQEITSKTFVDGLFDGADVVVPSVTGANAEAIAIFVKTAGANTTWTLVAWLDTGVTGLPVLPNGGNINITWHASGIFQL
ncbi:MAG: hypothetical protein IPN53_05160 [Comamonadaceae bacterium]|nr:hypothetical protein [Comamonadaceae bacterium]